MRSTWDRIRHTFCFEVIGLLIVMPLGSHLFHLSMGHMGGVAIISTIVATLWNYLYNLGFDKLMMRWRNTTRKTLLMRGIHAFSFEAGLLIILQPMIMYYLGESILDTLAVTASLSVFYMGYAFVYNLAYDAIFPIRVKAAKHA